MQQNREKEFEAESKQKQVHKTKQVINNNKNAVNKKSNGEAVIGGREGECYNVNASSQCGTLVITFGFMSGNILVSKYL